MCAAATLVVAAALRLGAPAMALPGHLLGKVRRPSLWTHTDTLGRGESLAALLARSGLSGDDAAKALHAARGLDDRRIPAGLEVRVSGDSSAAVAAPADSTGTPANDGRPSDIVLNLSADRTLRLTREGDHWTATEEKTQWTIDTVVVRGVVHSTLYDALDAGAGTLLPKGARAELAWTLADIYEYRVDMSRELQDGDAVRAVFERQRSPAGTVKIGTIISAGLERSGNEMQAYRFSAGGAVRPEYYDQSGRSMRAQFLRAPLSFRRISSVFGMRKHPILGAWRAHKGTDYAADAGTPVRAIGDGVVMFAGVKGGYGNCIDVRHPNGFVSRYGHLRAFARGVRPGAHVAMGSTIGFVGMTGLATAPHLHFEILVGGVQRDSRTALKTSTGIPLAQADQGPFEQVKRLGLAALEGPTGPVPPKNTAAVTAP
jgi:murein DD-endopeptidase MepM/ murein hydrolase activator NlpD